MSANMLTIVSAVAGIVVGFVTSWWFSRSAKRASQKEQASLHEEISILRGLLSSVADSVTKPGIEEAGLLRAQPVGQPAAAATTSLSPAPTSTVDVLVRASLGTLLNEHGEVSVPRLFRTVAHALPEESTSSISSSLEELRKAEKISWEGDDVRKAGVIKVHVK